VFRGKAFSHSLAAGTAALPGLQPSNGGSLIAPGTAIGTPHSCGSAEQDAAPCRMNPAFLTEGGLRGVSSDQ